MKDKYQFLRDSIDKLIAEATQKGGGNPRAQLILDLLADYDQLAASARLAAQRNKPLKDLPLCTQALSMEERCRLDENLKSLLAFLGAPGDWGYETQLGRVTVALDGLRRSLWTEVA